MKHRGNPHARQAYAARLERAEERRAREETAAAHAAARERRAREDERAARAKAPWAASETDLDRDANRRDGSRRDDPYEPPPLVGKLAGTSWGAHYARLNASHVGKKPKPTARMVTSAATATATATATANGGATPSFEATAGAVASANRMSSLPWATTSSSKDAAAVTTTRRPPAERPRRAVETLPLEERDGR